MAKITIIIIKLINFISYEEQQKMPKQQKKSFFMCFLVYKTCEINAKIKEIHKNSLCMFSWRGPIEIK